MTPTQCYIANKVKLEQDQPWGYAGDGAFLVDTLDWGPLSLTLLPSSLPSIIDSTVVSATAYSHMTAIKTDDRGCWFPPPHEYPSLVRRLRFSTCQTTRGSFVPWVSVRNEHGVLGIGSEWDTPLCKTLRFGTKAYQQRVALLRVEANFAPSYEHFFLQIVRYFSETKYDVQLNCWGGKEWAARRSAYRYERLPQAS